MDSFERVVSQSWLVASREQVDAIGEGILPRMLKNKTSLQIFEKKCDEGVASDNKFL